jgi:hypothetical protein
MRRILIVVLGAMAAVWVIIGLLVVLASGSGGVPVYAIAPTAPPAMHLVTVSGSPSPSTACVWKHYTPIKATGSGLVTVDPSPESVTAVWIPGMNSTPCLSVLTHGDQQIAVSLASALASEPAVPKGAYHCPMADGLEVELFFNYGAAHRSELAIVDLNGCLWITDPDRNSRWWSGPGAVPSFSVSLATLAPSPWHERIENVLHLTVSPTTLPRG